jgi:hypothetical protein
VFWVHNFFVGFAGLVVFLVWFVLCFAGWLGKLSQAVVEFACCHVLCPCAGKRNKPQGRFIINIPTCC